MSAQEPILYAVLNGMTLFNRTDLPMMNRTISRKVKLPSKIGLRSSVNNKLCITIKFDKAITITANLDSNIVKMGFQESK